MTFGQARRALLLLGLMTGAARADDPAWDPTEIARLAQQAAQVARNLSTTDMVGQTAGQLLQAVGAAGAPAAFSTDAPAMLSGMASLSPVPFSVAGSANGLRSAAPQTAAQRAQIRQGWANARQASVIDGLALAQFTNQSLVDSASRAGNLATLAGNAATLRADVQANSAVCLAVLAQLTSVEALLALLLQGRASDRLAQRTALGG